MNDILERYERTIGNSDAKRVIYSVLEYAVNRSLSGSSVDYVKDDELAHEIDEIIWEEIGDFLLSYGVYQMSDGSWAIDCIFAGVFCPILGCF